MTPEVAAVRESGEAMRSRLSDTLDAPRLKAGVPLAPLTTFLVGGPADLLYDATSGDDLAIAVTAARAAGIPWTILGLGANVLVGDHGIRGLVIRNASGSLAVEGTRMLADSGVSVRALIRESFARGLGGLEHYVGIPSTVGGALWQNLHFLSPAPARERTMFIAEVVRAVDLLLPDGSRVTVSGEQMQFGYDTSRLHTSQEVALRAEFALAPAERDAIERTAQENLAWRGARHPWLEFHPSAGSVFRKVEGVGAGRLIDQCGLKGYRVGGAQVSFLHANIIVNRGDATARDIRSLIGEIQERVHARFGVRLEPEIGFKGEF
ncbi:MAG: UDP-N-acetylmuramate dehydrogenase [Gemmatimonadaceae bacterium]|nr:UDP-N-acetylmuramate dehydrogenase [Gemmatimonadaceae bacterium]